MIHTHQYITINRGYDPTRTTALRTAFAKEMKQRFKIITDAIRKAVDEDDVFGLKRITVQQVQNPGKEAFAFTRSDEKIARFMKWLQTQVDNEILDVRDLQQVGKGINGAWTNKYIFDSYKRGVIRARYELQRAGYNTPSIERTGGIEMSMATPFHLDRAGLLYTRVYTELKGTVSNMMDTGISRVLSQGIADGDNPRLLARKLVGAINGSGMGDLGLTDTVGQFIPAERRAEILARTEIIRAHHQATIQEYRNWGVAGVSVRAEWKTAGDTRVCEDCKELQGHIFDLDEIENMIPYHPQCFIDGQIPIYTSKGWKPIGKVKIGDYVLTHKKRFKKVYALPRHVDKTEVITFKFKGDLKLSMTSNHPVLVNKIGTSICRWIKAGECKETDLILLLAHKCKRCDKLIPFFREYCSKTCLSLDITDKQWSNPEHRKNISKKNKESILKQYDSNKRNRYEIVKKANKKTREMVKKGTHPFQQSETIANNKLVTNLLHHRKASSERMKLNNPMFDPEILKKAQQSLSISYLNNPENRLNSRMAKLRLSDKMTWIEKRMSELLNTIGLPYIFQYPILRYNVDFAIPSLKIVIECDGEYWHKDKEKDEERQKKIENEGWFVLRYSGTKINQCLDEIKQELIRVISNHTGKYELVGWGIEKITKWDMKKNRLLYNLSVEKDESYIAKGVVVHNCRCCALPVMVSKTNKYERIG